MHTPRRTRSYMLLVITLVLASVHGAAAADEPLPSWTGRYSQTRHCGILCSA